MKNKLTPLQEAFEEASKEPYGFKNHLPVIWEQQKESNIDRFKRNYLDLYNILMHQIEVEIKKEFNKKWKK